MALGFHECTELHSPSLRSCRACKLADFDCESHRAAICRVHGAPLSCRCEHNKSEQCIRFITYETFCMINKADFRRIDLEAHLSTASLFQLIDALTPRHSTILKVFSIKEARKIGLRRKFRQHSTDLTDSQDPSLLVHDWIRGWKAQANLLT